MGYLPATSTSKISWVDVLYYHSKYYFVYVHAYTADKIIEHILEVFLEFAKASAIQSLLPLCEQCHAWIWTWHAHQLHVLTGHLDFTRYQPTEMQQYEDSPLPFPTWSRWQLYVWEHFAGMLHTYQGSVFTNTQIPVSVSCLSLTACFHHHTTILSWTSSLHLQNGTHFAKMWLHTEQTLSLFEQNIKTLGDPLCRFKSIACAQYNTKELPKEVTACGWQQVAAASEYKNQMNTDWSSYWSNCHPCWGTTKETLCAQHIQESHSGTHTCHHKGSWPVGHVVNTMCV